MTPIEPDPPGAGEIPPRRTPPPVDDLWAHRSEGMRCGTCMFYVPKERAPRDPTSPITELSVGRCRRHAPSMSGWPVMFIGDWCGDHKIDENKI